MTTEQIREMLQNPAYEFLRSNEHLKGKIIFLTLGGSYSYGTNVETSDVDIRGCALNSRSDLLGLSNFEQVVHTGTDTTVYSFNKLVSLLLNCNPNTIEMLGCRPEQYMVCTDIGREMIENRKLFLSKRAVNSFGGYANQQLRRLENALARDKLPQARKEEHILNSMKSAVKAFESRYRVFENGGITLYTAESSREDLDREIFADIHLTKYPVREFNSILNDLTNVVGTYEKLNHRNHKKDDNHLNKHAMHLIRLYLMCLDILEKGDIITYRGADLPLLMSIRRGEYQLEDGTYRPEFFEMVSDFEKRLDYAKRNTNLPEHPEAYNSAGLIDPFHGVDDLKNGIIRCVGNPNDRFGEDALRILRALRFASVYGFSIEKDTAQAIHDNAWRLTNIAAERIHSELCKLLLGNGVLSVLLDYSDVIATIIPEMKPCIGFNQNNKYHQYTIYDHIAHAVSNYTGKDIAVKVALLLHDIGKPCCYTEDENGGHFHGHGNYSYDISKVVLERLRFDTATKQEVLDLVLYHDTVIEPTTKTVRRWLCKIGERRFSQLLDVRMADIKAHAEGTQESRIERCVALGVLMTEILEQEKCFSLKDLAINGKDIISLGVPQGKQIGVILHELLEEVILDTLPNEHDVLLRKAVKLIERT